MSDFDWQTDEDAVWEDEIPPTPDRPRRRFPWRLAGIVTGLLLLASAVLYWQVTQRVSAANEAAENDILSSHNLINRIVATQDVDLLSPLLSGRDLGWARQQELLISRGLFYERPVFGLQALGPLPELALSDSRPYSVTLSPNLDAAELTFVLPYQVENQEDELLLAHTAVYRLGRERWLLAPPVAEFWGAWQTEKVNGLTFTYPERDAAVVERLAPELAANVQEICQNSGEFSCPPLSDLALRFSTDPESLLRIHDPAEIYGSQLHLELPTPSLVGTPLDESGYEALRQGYLRLLVTAVIANAVGYECCQHGPIFQAVMDYQLFQLGLRSWPVTQADYKRVVSSDLGIFAIAPFWAADSFDLLQTEDAWQIYAFTDFIMAENPGISPVSLLQRMLASANLNDWLKPISNNFSDDALLRNALSQSWWLYAQARLRESPGSPPRPPLQQLQVVCTEMTPLPNSALQADLLRLQWQDGRWQSRTELQFPGFMFFNPLPDDSGLVLQGIDFENDQWHTMIWQDGQEIDLPTNEAQFFLSLGQTDPNGRYLQVFHGEDTSDRTNPALLDLKNCSGSACALLPLAGNVLWSPDGKQTLFQQVDVSNMRRYQANGQITMFGFFDLLRERPIFRGDGLGNGGSEPVAEGTAPFWLTETEYGYVRHAEQPVNETGDRLVLASVRDEEPEVLLTSLDLQQAVPPKEQPARLTIQYAQGNPANPNQLAVLATAQSNGHLFIVDRVRGEVDWRLSFRIEGNQSFAFSPDGRYFVTTGVPLGKINAPGTVNAYFIHNISRNETQTVYTDVTTPGPSSGFDWSADGDWLAMIIDERIVHLVSPEQDYQQNIWLAWGGCSSIAWVDEN